MRYSVSGADAIPAKTTLARFDATSSSYTSDSNNKILIPISAGDKFIDTSKGYLYMKIASNHTDADGSVKAALVGNGAAVIEKLEIAVSGSSGKVESITDYNVYHLYDELWNSNVNDLTYRAATAAGGAAALESLALGTQLAKAGAAGNSVNVAIKLNAAFLNSYFNKSLPAGLNQFQIEITLASFDSAFVQMAAIDAPFTYTVSECRYYANCYQILDEQIMASYAQQVATQPLMWIGQSCDTITNSIAAATGRQVLQINASFRSLNGLCTLVRTSENLNTKAKNGINAFNLTNITSYKYRIMSEAMPSDDVDISSTNTCRSYIEASKVFAKHGKTHAVCSAVSVTQWLADDDAANDSVGHGSLCVDLKKFSDDRLVMQGLDTAGSSAPSTVEITFSSAPSASTGTTLCLHDRMFVHNPNGVVEAQF
jgi:hypothetical protein